MSRPAFGAVARRQRTWAFLAVVVVVVALVCAALARVRDPLPITDSARAGAPSVPAVHWPEGHGAGRWDGDPWVRALRESLTLLEVARNLGDYTGADLHAAFSTDILSSHAQTTADLIGYRQYAPGPVPFVVLELQASSASARISGCQTKTWAVAADSLVPSADEAASGFGDLITWHLALGADGVQRVVGIDRSGGYGHCRVDGAAVGYFEPAPPYGQPLESVTGPDGLTVERFGGPGTDDDGFDHGEARQPEEDATVALAAWGFALDREELALSEGDVADYAQVLVASYDAVSGAAADAASQVA